MTEMKYFATEEEQIKFYGELDDCVMRMRSPFITNNPPGQQWGVQWSKGE